MYKREREREKVLGKITAITTTFIGNKNFNLINRPANDFI